MRRILLILPETELEVVETERAIRLGGQHFQGEVRVEIAAPRATLAFYREQLGGTTVNMFALGDHAEAFDVFVFIEGYSGDVAAPGPHSMQLPRPDSQRTYWFLLGSRMKLVHPALYDATEYPFIDSHIFQRLSGRKHEFVSFPYGPLYSDVEVGPVNEFGFRVPPNYRKLAERASDHKLVVSFGGSAAFSFYCRPEEMFTSLLEKKVNATLAERGNSTRITVLNFGMHDNVVMQEMLTYMMFIEELNPDIVLAHDGHNDIYYGLQDDPYLLNNFNIIYQRYSEEWAKILHNRKDVATPQLYSMATDGHEMNMPINVIRTYFRRKQQFERMVKRAGAQFVWGVQPLHCSKAELSRREKLRYRQAERGQPHDAIKRKFLRCLYLTYDQMSDYLASQSDILLVDFNKIFRAYGQEAELLWDHCHTSPDGDRLIADHYHDVVMNLLLADKSSKP